MMSRPITLTMILLIVAMANRALAQCPVTTSDADGDCLDDVVEQALLDAMAPIVITGADDGNGGSPWVPLNVAWAVSKCRLNWYQSAGGPLVGSTGNAEIDMAHVLNTIQNHGKSSQSYFYRLGFRDAADRKGGPGNSPTLYGRCTMITESGHSLLRLGYYLFFGFNDTDSPDGYACNFGQHEGDWMGIELTVDVTAPNPRVMRAIFHNHGRQIFVDTPDKLTFEGLHPILYLERGSNEPWPYPGAVGFVSGTVPPCIGTNKIFEDNCLCQVLPPFTNCCGGEGGGWSAVREHIGNGPQYQFASVVNLGELSAQPGLNAEAAFIQEFPGEYGSYAEPVCGICIVCGLDFCGPCPFCLPCGFEYCCVDLIDKTVNSPPGPPHQCEMWRTCDLPSRLAAWPGCQDMGVVWVDFAYAGPEAGTPSQPFNRVADADPVVGPNGVIFLRDGSSDEAITLYRPMTLIPDGGPVTIGQ